MIKNDQKINVLYVSGGIVACLLLRLIPVRVPNVEPILALQMPFAKTYGKTIGFLFGAVSIVLYDALTGTLGVRTLITAGAYGLVGLLAASYFSNRSASRRSFVSFAVFGTVLYDALTGLTVGPLFFHQSFSAAFFGQIPFTILHVSGAVLFSALVSPAVSHFLLRHQKLKPSMVAASPLVQPIII